MIELFEIFLGPLIYGVWDRRSITKFFEDHGDRVRQIQWTPFATGWFSNWSERFYTVRYQAPDGTEKVAECRTGSEAGVVLREEEEREDEKLNGPPTE